MKYKVHNLTNSNLWIRVHKSPILQSLSSTPEKGNTQNRATLMAGTITTTMAILNPKCLTTTAKNPNLNSNPPPPKPTSLLSIQTLPKLISSSKQPETSIPSLAETAIAGAIFSAMSSAEPAMAAQQLAEGSDNRGLALLLPIIPAIAWVLFNILQPALNQLNRMRNK